MGIEISNNIRRKNQINLLVTTSKMGKMIYESKNLKKILKLPKLRQNNLTLVDPIISYSILGWGGTFYNAVYQLEISQNQIIRIIIIIIIIVKYRNNLLNNK